MGPIRPVQEVRIVTNTPVGVFRTIVIFPGRLDVVVVHRFLRQTSTCNTTARSAKLRRIEIAVAIGLWAFIFLVAVAFLLAAQFRG